MDAALRRKARQMLEIDRLMGLDAVPLGDIALPDAPDEPEATTSFQSAEPPPAGRPAFSRPAGPAARPAFAPRPPSPAVRPAAAPAPAPLPAITEPIVPNNLTPDQKRAALAELEAEHNSQCPHCFPQVGSLKMVFADGNPAAELMFVGEGPGEEEDRQGLPFVGKAGQLLNKQIAAMGLRREDVYIANIVKTRPPNNRVPTPDEAELCMPYLLRQIEIVQPKVIVTLGATATKYLLGDMSIAITKERGKWRVFRGIDLMPTFHPAFLLRSYTVENRQRVWDDLRKVLERLGLPIPTSKKASE